MANLIKFRHFGPWSAELGAQPEMPALSPAELKDRAKKGVGDLRRSSAAGWRADCGAAQATSQIWAGWAICTRLGYEPPGAAVLRFDETTHMGQFHLRHEPVGPAVFVPEHCRTVKRADLWHMIHQAGGSAEMRETVANPWGRLEPELKAVLEPVTGLAPADALAALLRLPSALVAACEAVVTRRDAERAASDARHLARMIAEFPAEEAQALAKDGGDGSALAGHGEGFWPRASVALWRRDEWWTLAKAARDYGLTEARDRCVARARLFHRLFLQFRAAEAAAAIVAEAARIAALPPPPTKEEKRAIAAARKADKAARSAAFQAKKAERERQRAAWHAEYARWSYPPITAQVAA